MISLQNHNRIYHNIGTVKYRGRIVETLKKKLTEANDWLENPLLFTRAEGHKSTTDETEKKNPSGLFLLNLLLFLHVLYLI